MLNILFGMNDDVVKNIDVYFDNVYEDDWFEDELVKEMILDVDQTEVVTSNYFMSSVLGPINPREISGGVKSLIVMLKTDEVVWATNCGDNCSKWILKIAESKNLTIALEHFMKFRCDFDARIINTNVIVHSQSDFEKEALRYAYFLE